MKALCPGSFDPITHGHLDVIRRARALFDEVLVGVGKNSTKNNLFTIEERVALVRDAVADLTGVTVEPLEGLLVDFARAHACGVVVKGLRFASDFDYELQMAHINKAVSGIESVFLPASSEYGTLSSTMLREVAKLGGDVSGFVTPEVNAAIMAKLGRG
ncbi:MAG TPA: pantetheine-phosphate adenylyltransferase [Propionibacteriaceae bacterium]|nr:pantetheine-phosphate adenylyltransferase [Propionibacteriaceae bacterium]